MKEVNFAIQGYFLLYPFDYVLISPTSWDNFFVEKNRKLLSKDLCLCLSWTHFKCMFKNFDQKISKMKTGPENSLRISVGTASKVIDNQIYSWEIIILSVILELNFFSSLHERKFNIVFTAWKKYYKGKISNSSILVRIGRLL